MAVIRENIPDGSFLLLSCPRWELSAEDRAGGAGTRAFVLLPGFICAILYMREKLMEMSWK